MRGAITDMDSLEVVEVAIHPVQVVTGAQKSASGYLEKVVDIDVSSGNDNGYGTSIALTESKEVYGWGYSGYGPLGQTGIFHISDKSK